jgi:hypothetical protein
MTAEKPLVSLIVGAALLCAAGSSDAQQPPDSVASDSADNTAAGTGALSSVEPDNGGEGNSAFGALALNFNTSGSANTAAGFGALSANSTGVNNSAVGYAALWSNSSGANNTAFGDDALFSNLSGKGNAAQGANALYSNTTGIRNLGIGSNALYANSTGSYNIALGFDAGYYITTGSYNIEIGALGSAGDNDTIQIGEQGTQTRTTIAGIYGTPVSGSAVYVNSKGQLGVQASSERFKTDIAPMPDPSARVAQLRPVTFRYKTDPKNVIQYGLIAEEVAKTYPELVIRDDGGQIMGIHYEELAPILLKEMQRERIDTSARINAQAAEIRALKVRHETQLAAQSRQIQDLQRQVAALIVNQQTGHGLVAQR